MPKRTTYFLGRAQLLILVIAGVLIVVGLFTFLTPHETLVQKEQITDENGNTVKTLFLTTRPSDNVQKPTRFVNGQTKPVISIRPGEVQRWEMQNESPDVFNIFLGGVEFIVISKNGELLSPAKSVTQEQLLPEETMKVLVTGPQWGSYTVFSVPIDGEEYVTDELLFLKSEGLPKF